MVLLVSLTNICVIYLSRISIIVYSPPSLLVLLTGCLPLLLHQPTGGSARLAPGANLLPRPLDGECLLTSGYPEQNTRILFRFDLLGEYSNLEYVRIHAIYRVT